MFDDDMSYVKLFRKTRFSSINLNSRYFHVFMNLLMDANYSDKKWLPVKTGANTTEVLVHRGELIFGRKTYAKRLDIPESTIRNIMEKLVKLEMIIIKPDTHWSLVKVCNYKLYQGETEKDGHPEDTQRTPRGHPEDTPKEEEEGKEKEEETLSDSDESDDPPAKGEVWFDESSTEIKLVDFYDSLVDDKSQLPWRTNKGAMKNSTVALKSKQTWARMFRTVLESGKNVVEIRIGIKWAWTIQNSSYFRTTKLPLLKSNIRQAISEGLRTQAKGGNGSYKTIAEKNEEFMKKREEEMFSPQVKDITPDQEAITWKQTR